MRRPLGVALLAASSIAIAAMGLILLPMYYGTGAFNLNPLLLITINSVYGWGLWTMKSWAWVLAIIASAFNLMASLYAAMIGEGLAFYNNVGILSSGRKYSQA